MRRDPEVVKTPPEAPQIHLAKPSFRRHLEGYELGALIIGIVLTCALLALPRASVPETLPLPRIDRAEARHSAQGEQALSAQAESEGLPFEIRAIGESVRHFGRSVVHGTDTAHDRQDIREHLRAMTLRNQGGLLLRLRAVQTQYFLGALARAQKEGHTNTDLDELGGDFFAQGKRNAWFNSSGSCLADEATLRAMFHMHWADLLEKRTTIPFSATLNEWRLYYRFLLEHPEVDASSVEQASDAVRLEVVAALGRKDPDYPSFLAKGYLFYRLGDREAAATAYRTQLALRDSGPYALLARNYLIYTLQGAPSE